MVDEIIVYYDARLKKHQIALIMLQVLVATSQNLVTQATRCPGFLYPCLTQCYTSEDHSVSLIQEVDQIADS